MKLFLILCLLIPLISTGYCDLQPSEFSLQFIQYLLNTTSEKVNIAVAPYQAYELYKELFTPPKPEQTYQYWLEETTTPAAVFEPERLITRNISTNPDNMQYANTLKARWSFNFQSRDIRKLQFYQLGSGDHRVWVDFLRKDDIFRYWEMNEFNASVLELPLHYNEMKCLFILPNEYVSLDEMKEFLSENPQIIMEMRNKSTPMKLVRALLPKFRVNYKQDLKDFYDEISSEDVEKYENIQQLTSLDVNERGIGEFERTTVLFWNSYSYLRVAPTVVEINRPFLFMITNKEHIQFFGQVVKM